MTKKFSLNNKIYVVCTTGAVGDTICSFPILKKLYEKNQIEKIFVQNRFFELFKLIFDENIVLKIEDYKKETTEIPEHIKRQGFPEGKKVFYLDYPFVSTYPVAETFKFYPSSLHMHLIDTFSISIADCILKEEEKNYPEIKKEVLEKYLKDEKLKTKKYVVMQVASGTEHRRYTRETFLEIKKYLFNKGYDVIILGDKNQKLLVKGLDGKDREITHDYFDLDFSCCIDYREKTTIVEALAIIAFSKAIIGIDGGLLHLAGLTDIPIIAGYTTVDPYYRIPYRKNQKGWNCYLVLPDSECKFCQTENFIPIGIDFLKCYNLDFQCRNSLTFEKWKKEIDKVL